MSGGKNSTITNVTCSTHIPRTHPLTLAEKINFLPLIEPNHSDSMVKVKVSQHRDAEKCDYVRTINTLMFYFRMFHLCASVQLTKHCLHISPYPKCTTHTPRHSRKSSQSKTATAEDGMIDVKG
jgi:hypothetical protein